MASKRPTVESVTKAYERAKHRAQLERWTFERNWFRNCLFYQGIQWIAYQPASRLWVPRQLKPWVPRPVTNKFAAHINTVIQVLSSRPPSLTSRPATESPDDIASSEVTNRIIPVLEKEARADEARRIMAAWVVLTGTAWLHPNWDNDPQAGTAFIEHMRCSQCGATYAPDESENSDEFPEGVERCPKCEQIGQSIPAVDETGQPVGEELPTGRLAMDVFSPFEVHVDPEARSGDEVQELIVRRRYSIEVVKRKYPGQDIQPDSAGGHQGVGLDLLRSLAYAAGGVRVGGGYDSGRSGSDEAAVTLDYYWSRPSSDHADGCVGIFANGKAINGDNVKDGLPYRDRRGNPIWPWHRVVFDMVPGRIWGRTPADDAAPKQEQRNKLEAMIEMIIRRSANPVWLLPYNSGITEITGEPGQVIEGKWNHDPRLKPERVPGENVPSTVMAWLEKIDNDMEEIFGTFEVLKGAAPAGVTAGTALRLLLERAVTRFTPVLQGFELSWGNAWTDGITIFQQFGDKERINRVQGPGSSWEVERFTNADLNGSVDVVCEAGSAVPKNSVGQQALVQDLQAMGMVDAMDPEVKYAVLQEFGSTKLLGSVDLNIKAAERENWNFLQGDDEALKYNPILDNHQVHAMRHRMMMLKSDFDLMDPGRKEVALNHLLQHELAMAPPPVEGPDGAPLPGAPPGGGAPPEGGMPPEAAGNGSPDAGGMPPLPPSSMPPPTGSPAEFPMA